MAEKTVYIIDLDDKVRAKLKATQDEAKRTDNEFAKMGKNIVGALAGAFAVSKIIDFGREAILATAKFQSMGNAIKFASDSAIQGELSMTWLSNFSGKWGIDLDAAAQGFKTFQGALINTKFSSSDVRKMFEQVSTGVVAMGLSADDAKGTFLALGQIMGKGKVQAEELRGQIGERVPGAFALAARAMGVTTAQLDKMMKDGQLLAEDFLPKFAAEMERTFGVGAANQVDSMSASLNRSTNAFLELQVAMGESKGGLIASSLTMWTDLLNTIANQFRDIDQLAGRGSNDHTLKVLGNREKALRDKKADLQKQGKSKQEIETALKYEVSSSQNLMGLKQAELQEQISAMEKRKINPKKSNEAGSAFGGVGGELFGIERFFADKESFYKNDKEYSTLVDALRSSKDVSKGLSSVADKEISNLYAPENALITKKGKSKKDTSGINLNESRNGATNIVFNIDTFQKNDFTKDAQDGTIMANAKKALQEMGIALLEVIRDGQIAAVR